MFRARRETYHRDWFLREARASNRVQHENIVDIYDFGDTEDGLFYLVMEYCEGTPLAREIMRGPLDLYRATAILEQCTAGLAAAHDYGVVHRDIKADNVLLTRRGGKEDHVKVIDFGLASLSADGKLEPDGAVFGTMEYMSPEQTRGEDATPASDQYALGVLFFEMLTARLPFRPAVRKELLGMHQTAPIPKASELNPNVPPHFDRVIERCMAKEPGDRYKSCYELLEELRTLKQRARAKLAVVKTTPPRVAAPKAGAKPTVVILDDSRMMLTLYGALLKADGFEVRPANSLVELDRVLEEVKPALILVDVNLPEVNGDQLVPILRSKYELDDVPIVLVSGMEPAQLEALATAAGAAGSISKSLPVERFVEVVRKQLRPCDRPKVFILDDDRMSLKIHEAILRAHKMEPFGAENLAAFDELMQKHRPAAVLCVVLMPEIDGDSAARVIRGRYDLDNVPIVLLSGLPEAELRERTEASEADGYIVKNGNIQAFMDTLRALLVDEVKSKRATMTDMLAAG